MVLTDEGRKLVEQKMGLVHYIASHTRFSDAILSHEDVVQDGMVGLIDGVERNTRGTEVPTRYLKVRIRGEIIDQMRRFAWSPQARDGEGVVGQPVSYDALEDWEPRGCDEIAAVDDRLDLRLLVDRLRTVLDAREIYVLISYYLDEMSLKQIGEVLGITESRVSQIKSAALEGARHDLMSTSVAA